MIFSGGGRDGQESRRGRESAAVTQASGLAASGEPDFSLIASTVVIVTTLSKGNPWGCTASVWAERRDPAVMLVTLARSSVTHGFVVAERRFCVNLLADGQAATAFRFGSPTISTSDRFEDVAWSDSECGLPVLKETRAAFACEVIAVHEFGRHDIIVGEVSSWWPRNVDAPPLMYFQGAMTTLQPPGGGVV
jgi:flavin reductase (DIM6/NTAB) family NADH-FMN oxidoreductase RutF